MEVEAKFSIPDERTLQQLLEATCLAGFSLEDPTETEIHDRYLDTAGGALRARGYACRLRRQNGQTIATLKGLGAASGPIHRRVEHQVDLPESVPPQQWPASPARDIALRLGGDEPLIPLFEIRQTRRGRLLHDGPRVVAELNLDSVRLPPGEIATAPTLELEAELLPQGNEEDLRQLAVELQERWGLSAQPLSKFERGLALSGLGPVTPKENGKDMGTHPPIVEQPPAQEPVWTAPGSAIELLRTSGIQPDDPMSEAGRKTLRLHFRRMIYNEPGSRLGEDIEALHDMRVATRRQRAAFRVFGEYYEPEVVAPYLKGLKRTGRILGPVRDLDVFQVKVQDYLGTLPEQEQESLNGFLSVLEIQRKSARNRMLAYLDSRKYARFKERFGQFVETEGIGSQTFTPDDGDPRPYRVRHVAPVAVYERLAAVRAYDEWVTMSGTDSPGPPLKRLHALRIACKRLRYTLEFFRDVLGPNNWALIKEIVTMQDHLGDLQDAVVASGILREFLQFGTWGQDAVTQPRALAPADVRGAEAYLEATLAELVYLVDTFPQAWEKIQRVEFSQMVAGTVAVL